MEKLRKLYPAIPAEAEEIMAARDIMLARRTGAKLHLAHLSTAGSMELLKWGKASGVKVTGETAPHYFTLTEELVKTFDSVYKMNPPLRAPEDLLVVAAGGPAGGFGAVLPPWLGSKSRAVTQAITLPTTY